MANDNNPRGFLPATRPPLSAHYYRVHTGADIYVGCPVYIEAAGYVRPQSGNAANICLGVALGFAGTLKRGLATPDPFLDVSDLTPPSPSSDTGDRWVLVADDPNQEYIVQEDTGGTALSLAEIGAYIDFIYRGATVVAVNGDADTGWANVELDADSVAAGSTDGTMVLLGLHDVVNSDGTENAVGDYAKWRVRIAHHQKIGAQLLGSV